MTVFECLRDASQGNREQLAEFAASALNSVIADPLRSETHLSEAATFARLAAMHGNAKDMQVLAGVLLVQAHLLNDRAGLASQRPDDADDTGYFIRASNRLKAQAIQWLNAAADAGSDDATSYLLMLADAKDNADAFEMARQAESASPITLLTPSKSCPSWGEAALSAIAGLGAARSAGA